MITVDLLQQSQNKKMRLKIIFLILFFSLVQFVFAQGYDQELKEYDKEIRNKQQELQKLYKEIQKLDRETEKTKKKEKSYRQEINKIEENIRVLTRELRKLEEKKKQTERQVRQTEKMYQLTEEERVRLANLLREEMKFIYTWRKVSSDLRKDYYLLAFIRQKGNVYESTENRKKQLEKEKNLLLEKREKIIQEKDKIQTQEKTTENLKKEKEQTLAQVEQQRIAQEKEIENLKKTAEDLGKFIFELEAKKKMTEEAKKQAILAQKVFAEKKGYLPWPVEGEVVATFGKKKHPELNTYIVNNGIKIRPKQDKKVCVIAEGTVVYAGEFQTYGRMVIIDHLGGYYSIYGLLGEILVKEGKNILLGEQIGNLANDPLYFELRSEGQPVDPLLWLHK